MTVEELLNNLKEKKEEIEAAIDMIEKASNGFFSSELYVGRKDSSVIPVVKAARPLPRPILTRANGRPLKGNARSIAAKHWTQDPKNRKKVMAKVRAMNAARKSKPFWNQRPENKAKVMESVRRMNESRLK